MASYFFDSSAIVKRQAPETGHAWIRSLCDPLVGNNIVIAETAIVEVIATFCRMAREYPPRINTTLRDRFITRFQRQVSNSYRIVQVDRTLYIRAANLCRTHPLRAFDSLQLACALTYKEQAQIVGIEAPIFVCADIHLLNAASAEGFVIENPNSHT